MTLAPITFESLATDLCSAMPPFPNKGNGRPPSSAADVIFVGICRLNQSFHKKTRPRGNIPGHVHSNVVLRRQRTPEILESLPLLLHESSRPLVSPERMVLQTLYVKNWKRLYQEGELPRKRGGVEQSTAVEVKYDQETNLITELRFVQEVRVDLMGEDHPIAQGMNGRSGAKNPPGVQAEIYLKAISHNLRTIVGLGQPVVFWGGKTPAQHQAPKVVPKVPHQAPKVAPKVAPKATEVPEGKGLAAFLATRLKLVEEAQNKIGFIMSEFDYLPRADRIDLVVGFIVTLTNPSGAQGEEEGRGEVGRASPRKVTAPKETAPKEVIRNTPPPSTAPVAPKSGVETDLLSYGKRIREARLKAGLSQSALGRLVGYKQPHIANIEAGRHTPSERRFNEFTSAIENATTPQPVPPSEDQQKKPAVASPDVEDVMQAARDILGL